MASNYNHALRPPVVAVRDGVATTVVRRETVDDLLATDLGAHDVKPLNVAVLGCGSVGSQVVRLLTEQAGDLAARVGAPVELVGVAVRRIDAPRERRGARRAAHHRRRRPGRPRRRRRGRRGDRRHRAGPLADPGRAARTAPAW